MRENASLNGPARAVGVLRHAFEFGASVERPGVITATHAATWHMAGLIEQLHTLRSDQAELLRRRGLERGEAG